MPAQERVGVLPKVPTWRADALEVCHPATSTSLVDSLVPRERTTWTRFRTTRCKRGDWMITTTMTTMAKNTGLCADGTPRKRMVDSGGWVGTHPTTGPAMLKF